MRWIANTLIGLSYFLKRYPYNAQVSGLLRQLSASLAAGYDTSCSDNWRCFETHLTYDNAALPLAMMNAAVATRCTQTEKIAMESAEFLPGLLFSGRHLSVIGNKQWVRTYGAHKRFAQQPIEAMGMVKMCSFAFELTGKQLWKERMLMAFDWFHGGNDLGIPFFDPETMGCCDDLEHDGVNRNQGAESTIAYLISCPTVSKHNPLSIQPVTI